MASRWELLSTIIANANLDDEYEIIEDLQAMIQILHNTDSFMEQAAADPDVLAITMPEVSDMLFDFLAERWTTSRLKDYEQPTKGLPNSHTLARGLSIAETLGDGVGATDPTDDGVSTTDPIVDAVHRVDTNTPDQ